MALSYSAISHACKISWTGFVRDNVAHNLGKSCTCSTFQNLHVFLCNFKIAPVQGKNQIGSFQKSVRRIIKQLQHCQIAI